MKRALLFLIFGCTPSQRPLAVADIPAREPASSATAVIPEIVQPQTCEKELRMGDLRPETPTCQVYGISSGDVGKLLAPCGGSGNAEAHFGKVIFRGTMTNGTLRLSNEHSEDIGDGCGWRFFQEISGSGNLLRFTYHEKIEDDTHPVQATCYRPCGATADVDVAPLP